MSKNLVFLDNFNFCMLLGNLKIYVTKLNRTYISKEEYIPESNYYKCLPDHKHDEFEFHVISKGKGFIKINDVGLEINAGELFITGPNVRHMQSSSVSDPMFEYCLRCKIETVDNVPELKEFSCIENNLIIDVFSKPCPVAFKDIYRIDMMFEEVFLESEKQFPGYYLKIQTLIINIILSLFRTIVQSSLITQKCEMPNKPYDTLIAQRLAEYVEVNYRFHNPLKKVSEHLKINQKQINSTMKKTYNMSFHDYIRNYRFSIAKELLQTTNLSIEEIAYQSGFSSIHYMYQVFKHFGSQTPLCCRLKTL